MSSLTSTHYNITWPVVPLHVRPSRELNQPTPVPLRSDNTLHYTVPHTQIQHPCVRRPKLPGITCPPSFFGMQPQILLRHVPPKKNGAPNSNLSLSNSGEPLCLAFQVVGRCNRKNFNRPMHRPLSTNKHKLVAAFQSIHFFFNQFNTAALHHTPLPDPAPHTPPPATCHLPLNLYYPEPPPPTLPNGMDTALNVASAPPPPLNV